MPMNPGADAIAFLDVKHLEVSRVRCVHASVPDGSGPMAVAESREHCKMN
jgi:hypothetical protein